MSRMTAKIGNVDCIACVEKLKRALMLLDGVLDVSVGYPSGRAVIEFDERRLSERDLVRCIMKAGFRLPVATIELITDNADKAANVLRSIGTVKAADAMGDGAVSVQLWQTDDCVKALLSVLSENGIAAQVAGVAAASCEAGAQSRQTMLLRGALFSAFCLIPLLWQLPAVAKVVVASIVQLTSGAAIYLPALRAVKNRTLSPDILRAIAITGAYAYMICAFSGEYWLAPVAITFILLGKYLECAGVYATESSLRRLMRLQPKTARVRRDGCECELGVDELFHGDEVLVESGERVPADGVVTHGQCMVDEMIITGSDLPVEKREHDTVTGGTLLREGSIVVSELRTGNASVLHGIIDRAQTIPNGGDRSIRLAEKLAAAECPAAVLLALAVFAAIAAQDMSAAAVRACGLLMAVSPGAIALAAPTALTVGLSSAAEHGYSSLSKEAIMTARVNIAFSVCSNAAAIVLTITGTMPILAAAAVGAFTPVIVIFNSLRARYKR